MQVDTWISEKMQVITCNMGDDEGMPVFAPDRKRNVRGERRVASLLDAAGHVFGELGYHAANTNAITAEGKVSPATLYQFFPNKEAIADALVARYAMDLAEEVRAADIQKLASGPLEDVIRQVTGVVIEFHRKHSAFRTLHAAAPLSKDTLKQKHLLSSVHRLPGRGAECEKPQAR
jgi:AcrR family transcriptional regulator